MTPVTIQTLSPEAVASLTRVKGAVLRVETAVGIGVLERGMVPPRVGVRDVPADDEAVGGRRAVYLDLVAEMGWSPLAEKAHRERLGAVVVYSAGFVMCSACAPSGATRLQVEAAVNRQNPTGISSPWTVSDEPWNSDDDRAGHIGPVPCATDPNRTHWLLAC